MPHDPKDPFDPAGDPRDAFVRTLELMGEAGFAALQEAHVAVVGLGGVGSHAAAALARSGIGRLTVVDFDRVSWSSLNRHALALPADVGLPKAEVVARRLRDLRPDLRVHPHRAFLDEENVAALLGEADQVIDAIDALSPKVALLRWCVDAGVPVVSAMGAAGRTDPGRVRVVDLADTQQCPLARKLRKRLHRVGIRSGITAVYSPEKPAPTLDPDEERALPRGRARRMLPSIATIPGIFGYAAAGAVMQALAAAVATEDEARAAAGR